MAAERPHWVIFGPLVMGALIDAGVSIEAICGLFALYCAAATALQNLGLRGLR